jgi:nicotinic acid mononucleotide adenylyltransferase
MSTSPPEFPHSSDNPTPLDYLREHLTSIPAIPNHSRAILLTTGSLCPVHIGHLKMFDIAAKFLRESHKIDVIIGYLSPSSDLYVSGKLLDDSIPFSDRYQMGVLACCDHNNEPETVHLECDPWEGMEPTFVSFPKVRDRFQKMIDTEFPNTKLLTFYLCGSDHFLNCQLHRWNRCVVISRAKSRVRYVSNREKMIYVCNVPENEDEFGEISSTEVRRRIGNGESLDGIVYPSVIRYLQEIEYTPSNDEE